ncbi:MAG TPA: thiaminase II [Actinomycetota bacterium]|nr:thiaminase II [Actinomycetota bacterium]
MRSTSGVIWDALHGHPFLRELAGGTLPLEKFRFFVEQDDYFLEDYARCLAIGVSKSRNDEELRYFATDLRTVLDDELPNNHELLSRVIALGADERGGSSGPAPATVAYTSYLQAVATRGGSLELMAALLPCAWSYIEIAIRLAGETPSNHPIYAEWISFFSTPENVTMVDGMRADLDRLVEAERVSETRRRSFERIFATSSRLERMFWDMAYGLQHWPDPVRI